MPGAPLKKGRTSKKSGPSCKNYRHRNRMVTCSNGYLFKWLLVQMVTCSNGYFVLFLLFAVFVILTVFFALQAEREVNVPDFLYARIRT